MTAGKPKLRELFSRATECRTAEELSSFLDQVCEGDTELRAQLEELLQAQHEDGSCVEEQSDRPAATIDLPGLGSHTGALIGPYKLLEQIGEGGFGIVYLAEQSEPVRRKVALKIVKPGMDSRQVVARFEAERQALA